MRVWERAPHDCQCGMCGKALRRGDPRQVIVLAVKGKAVKKNRCGDCADGPTPPDLPPPADMTGPEIEPVPKQSFSTRRPLLALAKDFRNDRRFRDGKLAALGREPGEDDE